MEIGQVSTATFLEKVECKGYIFAPTHAMAKVSTPISGKINTLRCKVRDYVTAGQVVATISGNEFMNLQQIFAEAAIAYTKAKADYERASALWAEQIGAKKDYLAAKSIYNSTYAGYLSLKARITTLHINPTLIEQGKMSASFPITAPISGYITKVNTLLGEYTDMQNYIAEIVNPNALQLRLEVFDTDIRKLHVGQQVIFGTGGNDSKNLRAKISNIGKIINPDTKAINCIATIDKSNGTMIINDSYVEAIINISSKQGFALPISAVQKQGENYFVYTIEKKDGEDYKLKKNQVIIGAIEQDYIEIKTKLPKKKIMVRGIENL